jgi:hypothetical protein
MREIIMIVYSSDNNGDYTKERFIQEIKECMLQTPEFKNLTNEQFKRALNFTYRKVLGVIQWETPATYYDQFDYEDIQEILMHVKTKKVATSMDFKYKIFHNHKVYGSNSKKDINNHMKENKIDTDYCITCNGEKIEDKRVNPFNR